MIGDVIYTLLSNDSDVINLVGTNIYPSLAIEDISYPYIVYDNIGNVPTDDKDGVSSLDTSTYDIEIYTKTLEELNDLSIKVRTVLDRYTGTVNSKVIQSIKYNDENTGYDDNDRIYMKAQEYQIRFLNPLT